MCSITLQLGRQYTVDIQPPQDQLVVAVADTRLVAFVGAVRLVVAHQGQALAAGLQALVAHIAAVADTACQEPPLELAVALAVIA